ncbi:MAG TPA: hypothetical protein DHV39_00770, partial [Verrucomicrobiales bacterium]|nr:hypothetical protein [Verrucomicrobiales bacterium]
MESGHGPKRSLIFRKKAAGIKSCGSYTEMIGIPKSYFSLLGVGESLFFFIYSSTLSFLMTSILAPFLSSSAEGTLMISLVMGAAFFGFGVS